MTEKELIKKENAVETVANLLVEIQENIYQKAVTFNKENTHQVDDYKTFKEVLKKGGFIYAHWDGTAETEEKIKEETKATIRCIPMKIEKEEGKCVYSGRPSKGRVLFAKAY
mgnify:FL=1